VRVVPHPVEPIAPGPRSVPGVPDASFVFVSVLQWSERKNPVGLLRAFRRAFSRSQDVALLLHVGLRGADAEAVMRRIANGTTPSSPHVYVCLDTVVPATIDRLYRRADAYVSLHRAEGFGLCLAEAMSAGVAVVATAHSGNLDFMDERTAFLVPGRLVPSKDERGRERRFDPYACWAEPEEEAAVEAMRACVAQDARRARVADAGKLRVCEQLAPERIGAAMRERLEAANP
jgi:glycosyltransferase involved in cell wall biosynthesis